MSAGSEIDDFTSVKRRVIRKDPDTLAVLNSYSARRINKSYAMDRLGIAYYGQLLELMGLAKLALPKLPDDVIADMVCRVREMADGAKSDKVRLVVPDAGVLMALAHGDLLDMLFAVSRPSGVVITDVAMFGALQGSDEQDRARIEEFQADHAELISSEATLLSDVIEQANAGLDPASRMAPYLGEMGMYGYLDAMYKRPITSPTVVLFEDEWFINREYRQTDNLQLISLMAFLHFVEKCNPVLFHERALAKIVSGGS